MNIFAQRLLNAARAVEEGNARDFDMNEYANACGTPACVLGHFATRTDLQDVFELTIPHGEYRTAKPFLYSRADVRAASAVGCLPEPLAVTDPSVVVYFGLTRGEAMRLFGRHGCGGARTAAQAIAYIQAFVALKWPEALDAIPPTVRALFDQVLEDNETEAVPA